jgi:hypothetical protein
MRDLQNLKVVLRKCVYAAILGDSYDENLQDCMNVGL